ncbi:MAG: DNA/RNA non-specific endonuclease [Coleofasciculus sp. C1-SOL-03]|uniref:DNA/RNA non-specific endonuclease n=1 Tax=Coleofasciculus sp. C1-SOL-03 TaxID=3069522 RepID=UPI0032FA1042
MKRYEGPDGWVRWGKDKLFGIPPEVTGFFDEGRNQYLNEVDKGLTDIANYVSEQLNKAKERITEGREEIKEYVAGLPEALKQVGTEAAQDIQTKFDDLEQSVKDKETELVDKLAQQYTENLQQLDAQIKEMKASNQPWFAQAFDAMAGVIDTINKLKNMLQNVLAKAASAIGSIIKDPIGFLGNLVSGVKQGLNNFLGNIMNHLQGGLIGWLTGAMGSMGIQLPDDIFSLKGIFSLVMQILGMTWNYIRRKAVKLFGEPVVAGMEKSVEIFQIIANQGPMGLWEQVQEQFGDLKETVIEEIKGMLITQVITAGIKWIIGLLNPASAFVKAAMAIYDIVMFFINQGSQVVELVNAVIEAITAIASGAVGGAAKLVENALARSLPVVIGFLASLLGISGLAKKVQGIVKKIRSRIDKAIDKVLKKAKKFSKKFGNKVKEKGKTVVKSLVNWASFKKSFKTQDGESHKLYFKGQGNQAKLIVASKEEEVKQFLEQRANVGTDRNKQNALAIAKYKVSEIYSKKNDLAELDKQYEEAVAPNRNTPAITLSKLQGEINRLISLLGKEFEELKDNLIIIGVVDKSAETLTSHLEWNLPASPTFAKAEPLTALPGNTKGSDASNSVRDVPGWSYLDQIDTNNRNNDRSIYNEFRRMHLIHFQMHGPANKQNLVPGTANANTNHHKYVEAKILPKLYQPGTIMWYEVRVTYHAPPHDKFAEVFDCSWGMMKWENGQAFRDGQLDSYQVRSNAPEPLKSATSGSQIVKIQGLGRKLLQSKLGFSQDVARRVAAACQENNSMDVYAAMDKYYNDAQNVFRQKGKNIPYKEYLTSDKTYVAKKVIEKPNGFSIDLTP